MFRPKAVFVLSLVVVSLCVFAIAGVTGCGAPKKEAPPPPAPAAFQISNLAINPAEVNPGEKVAITAELTNTGGTEGSYTAELKLNDVIEATQRATLAAGTSQSLNFIVSKDIPGTYTTVLGKLTGEFIVVKPAPPPPVPLALVPPKPTERTWTLTDANATRLFSGFIPGASAYLLPGGKVKLSEAYISMTFTIGVSDDKLWLGGVPAWLIGWLGPIHRYTDYDYSTNRLFLTALPPSFDSTKEIAPDVTKLPVVKSITTKEGEATITYIWP